MTLAEDQHAIQTLPPDTCNQSLGISILPRTPRGGRDLVDAQVCGTPLKASSACTMGVMIWDPFAKEWSIRGGQLEADCGKDQPGR